MLLVHCFESLRYRLIREVSSEFVSSFAHPEAWMAKDT
jgi:hypothetical protein